MKILSPAGNLESLKMAVYNGADEVYLGINDFNARNNIDGFTLSTLKEAIDFAHAYNVKVLLAINILFSDDELQAAVDTLAQAYNLGVDAFIIQDLALAYLVHQNYPEVEIHASTQMAIHNLEGVKAIEKYGFKRIVLARETPLEEIKRIKENVDVEIEYFCQGALCVCFSGNCYLSSYLFDASGNRGKCKQLCRLPYTLEKNGKKLKSGYLLSAKDFNMINRLDDLKNAGVDVLKIEGRARRPAYVGIATREYKKALLKQKTNVDNLRLAFNRGYTAGYFDGNGNIISNHQNHIGICVGEVIKVNLGKKFNEVYISSSRSLSPKSTFKFFTNGEEKTTLTAYDLKEISKGVYCLTTTQTVSVKDKVHLIVDAKLEEQVLALKTKRKIKIKLYLKTNEPLKAILKVNGKEFEVLGEICQPALKQPITKEEILNNFSKSDMFEADIEIEEFKNIFLPKQKLNDFRRNVFEKIYQELTRLNRQPLNKIKVRAKRKVIKFENFQIIENKTQKLEAKNIIYSPSEYDLEDIKEFKENCEKQNKKVYLDTPNFALKEDIKLLKNIIDQTGISIVANNYYALIFETNIIIGAGLNVYNTITASILNSPIITAESDISKRIDFAYMTLRHCPFKCLLNANCSKCPYSESYTYKMDNGKVLKLKRKKLSTCTFYLQ